ncbi:hypothetical protein IQ251_12840 [Saccharopolyspora sp. HNM0983]|uniref:Uncharacterized protein n=1 Tax=Saccharopolyspora montiporae TaxID=2781240 RepID=A0A929B8R8_9PSEU|nr:hypothetical protein [Saccharopolyspora sp. HNM0983]MBE9375332.1 hypothetical protein [Saccharopolyspora sp. HNM0983]
MHFDRRGNPIDEDQWEKLAMAPGNQQYRRVARTRVTDPRRPGWVARVNTDWIGIDCGFGAAPRPLIFETQVDEYDERGVIGHWPDEGTAAAAHRAQVQRIAARIPGAVVVDLE